MGILYIIFLFMLFVFSLCGIIAILVVLIRQVPSIHEDEYENIKAKPLKNNKYFE